MTDDETHWIRTMGLFNVYWFGIDLDVGEPCHPMYEPAMHLEIALPFFLKPQAQ